jgi:hypothetical protein
MTRVAFLTAPIRPAGYHPVQFAAQEPRGSFNQLMGDNSNPNLVVDERHNHAAIAAPADPVINRCPSQNCTRLSTSHSLPSETGMTSCQMGMLVAPTCTRRRLLKDDVLRYVNQATRLLRERPPCRAACLGMPSGNLPATQIGPLYKPPPQRVASGRVFFAATELIEGLPRQSQSRDGISSYMLVRGFSTTSCTF